MSFVLLLVYWWEQGVPFIEYVWAIGNWEFYLDFQAIANWQLSTLFGFRENYLDFKQPAIGNLIRISMQSAVGHSVWILGNRQLRNFIQKCTKNGSQKEHQKNKVFRSKPRWVSKTFRKRGPRPLSKSIANRLSS